MGFVQTLNGLVGPIALAIALMVFIIAVMVFVIYSALPEEEDKMTSGGRQGMYGSMKK